MVLLTRQIRGPLRRMAGRIRMKPTRASRVLILLVSPKLLLAVFGRPAAPQLVRLGWQCPTHLPEVLKLLAVNKMVPVPTRPARLLISVIMLVIVFRLPPISPLIPIPPKIGTPLRVVILSRSPIRNLLTGVTEVGWRACPPDTLLATAMLLSPTLRLVS